MPALPAAADVVRLDLHFRQANDSNMQIRQFFRYTGALSQADSDAWLATMSAAWGTRIATPQTVTGCDMYLATLTDLSSSSAPQSVLGTVRAGANGADPLPNGTALIIKKKIARRYRGGHPKFYLPGQRVANVTADQFAAGFLTTMLTAYGNFISDVLTGVPVAAAPAFEVNVSYFSGFHNVTFPSGRQRAVPTPRGTPVVDLVLAHSANPTVASQRRRNETP